MSSQIKPYQSIGSSKKEQVTHMFDKIAKEYDWLNRIITFGLDLNWRKRLLKLVLKENPSSILDIATGTGDLAISFLNTNAQEIVGVDISKNMLEVAAKKVKRKDSTNRISLLLADAENLPFKSDSFDVCSISYGIRNFDKLHKGLKESNRVLKKSGVLIILETSVPDNKFLKKGFKFYTSAILPAIGKLFSKDKKAYHYLGNSAQYFPYGQELRSILNDCGFSHVEIKKQALGIATIYKAKK